MKKFAGIAVPLIVMVFLVGLMAGCGSSSKSGKAQTSTPDYSQAANWLNLPSSTAKKADVFFLYPSAYEKTNPSDPMVCAIDNPTMMAKAKLAYGRDATCLLYTSDAADDLLCVDL